MTDISKVVQVQIDVKSKAPTRASFGTPLIACVTPFQDIVREYSDPATMLDDGFLDTSAAYEKAVSMWSQDPHPQTFKVGKRSNIPTYEYQLAPQVVTQGFVYDIEINGVDVQYTVPAAATKGIVATGLQALINAISGVTAIVVANDFIAVEDDTAGHVHSIDLKKMDPIDHLRFDERTVDPGIASDLSQIYKVDPNWYGLVLDIAGRATIEAAATWVATRRVIMSVVSHDTDVIDVAVTDDLFSTLQDNSYDRVISMFRKQPPYNSSGHADAAWLSLMLTFDPGTATWAHKTLTGVPVDDLQAGWMSQIEAKGGNHYTELAGIGATLFGIASSGEYVDITRFVDFLVNTIGTEIWRVKANNKKIPFTDQGIAILVGAVQAVLGANTATPEEPAKGLAAIPPPRAFAPKALDLPVADRIARRLDKIDFTANLAGAIHTTKVVGSISV